MTRRRTLVAAAIVAAVAVAAFSVGVVVGHRGTPAPERVYVYGDSLIAQSRGYLTPVAEALDLDVTVHAFGGTAPCDWRRQLAEDLRRRPPHVVVLAFSGNNYTGCMQGPDRRAPTGQALVDKYRADLTAEVAAVRRAGSTTLLASPPAARDGRALWQALDSVYRQISASDPTVTYIDAGLLIAPDGNYSQSARCLPFELTLTVEGARVCGGDDVTVRAPDGRHLCDESAATAGPTTTVGTCPGYSSGAARLAVTILAGAKLSLARGNRSG